MDRKIRDRLVEKGAALVGYADLLNIPEQNRKGLRYGISIAAALNPEIVAGIKNGPTEDYYHENIRVNTLLDELAAYAAGILEASGYTAYPQIIANVVEDEATWKTPLPHKTVATHAGLGWIGKCALLITKDFGSAVRITSVLTDAVLNAGKPISASQCGNCTICTDVCPGNAVKGINWLDNRDRDTFYDAFACRKTARERTAKIGIQASMCGLCMYSCPYTQRYLNR